MERNGAADATTESSDVQARNYRVRRATIEHISNRGNPNAIPLPQVPCGRPSDWTALRTGFNTVAGCWPDPGGFLPEARTGAREAARHMKNLAERFAELRNAIMRLPGNPACDDRAGLRHQLLHFEDTLMSVRGSLDDVIIAIAYANDAAL